MSRGGSGTRPWPLSRKSAPKRFGPRPVETMLLPASAQRLTGPGCGAPAARAAALRLEATDPETLMLMAPPDHVVPDAAAFRAAMADGAG